MRRDRENQRQSECLEHATPFGPGQRISIRAAVCEQPHQGAAYTSAAVISNPDPANLLQSGGPIYVHTRLTGYDRSSQSWGLSPQTLGRILLPSSALVHGLTWRRQRPRFGGHWRCRDQPLVGLTGFTRRSSGRHVSRPRPRDFFLRAVALERSFFDVACESES